MRAQQKRNIRFFGIRRRIIAYFGVLSLLISSGLLVVMLYGARWLGIEGIYHLKEAEIVHALESAADVKKQSILTWLSERRTELAMLADSGDVAAAASRLARRDPATVSMTDSDVALLSEHLRAIREAMPDTYDTLVVVTADGTIAASSEPEQVGSSYPFRDFLADACSVGAAEMIGSSVAAGHPLLLIARQIPMRDRMRQETGEVAGVIIVQTRPQQSLESLTLLPGMSATPGNYMALAGPKGELLASLPALPADAAAQGEILSVLARHSGSRSEGSQVEVLPDGRRYIAAYRYVPIGAGDGWGIAVAMDEKMALAPLALTRERAALFGLGMILVALVLVGWVAGRIAKPIQELHGSVRSLEEGDFSARARVDDRSSDEIGRLAAAFNSMARRIENWHLEMELEVAERTWELLKEKESTQRYLDIAGVLLLVLDRSGRIRMINKTGAELLDAEESQLLGLDWFDNFLLPEDVSELRHVFDGLMQGEEKLLRHYENRILTATKRERLFSWHNSLLQDEDGRITGVLSSGEDITEKRRAEVERADLERQLLHTQKLESLGVLAGGIAHDFNNLLMAISGNLELMRHVVDPGAPVVKFIDNAFNASKRAADLTKQMLAYSGKGGYCVKPLDLNRLVCENVELMKPTLGKGATLLVQIDQGLPLLEADPGQMQQAVVNLVTNAAESLGEGGGTIRVSTGVTDLTATELAQSRLEQKPAAGRFLFVEIEDSGCGMDRDTRDRMFDPFFTTKFTGRGLGLSALLGIMRGHGGGILVDSAPGRGTTVKLLFPAPLQPSAEVQVPVRLAREGDLSGTVLIVDDEEMVRTVCREMVGGLGYRTMVASGGAEAIELFRENAEIGTVIIDLSMPGMDGMAAAAEIRGIRPGVRIVLSSGYSADDAARSLTGQDGAVFIQKPYDLKSLREVLGEGS